MNIEANHATLAGYSFHHEVAYAAAHGITVCNTPGINRVAVAEMAMALVMSLARRVCLQDRLIRSGETFNRIAGIDTLRVPYKSAPPALTDVIVKVLRS